MYFLLGGSWILLKARLTPELATLLMQLVSFFQCLYSLIFPQNLLHVSDPKPVHTCRSVSSSVVKYLHCHSYTIAMYLFLD